MISSVDSIKFSDDCAQWTGYKPCPTQKEQGFFDCSGCGEYEQADLVRINKVEPFGPESFEQANTVGIVEIGGLGSILRTTAVSGQLRQNYPNVQTYWFTHDRGSRLLRYVPGVIPVNTAMYTEGELAVIAKSMDVILNFETNNKTAEQIVAHARRVGGFALNQYGKFVGVAPYANNLQKAQVDDGFRKSNDIPMQRMIVEAAALPLDGATYSVTLSLASHLNAQGSIRSAFGYDPEQVIGLNIGTSEKGKLRRWPVGRFMELADQLAAKSPGTGILIMSGPDDRDLLAEALRHEPTLQRRNVAYLTGEEEVGDFMAVVSKLDCIVTADTFGFHVAKSFHVPTVVLAGPMPHRELELEYGDELIGPKGDCSPCYHRCSQFVLGRCMQEITVDEVADAVSLKVALKLTA